MLAVVRGAWAQVAGTVLGVWLMAAPAVLGYAGTAAAVHRIVGPVVASVSFVAVWEHMRPLRWANLGLGALLVVVPWLLSFPLPATVAGVVTGVVLAALAFVRGRIESTYGGGWLSLWTGDVAHEEAEHGTDTT